jgi:hypothetical protein
MVPHQGFIYMLLLFSFFVCPFSYLWRHSSMTSKYLSRHISCMGGVSHEGKYCSKFLNQYSFICSKFYKLYKYNINISHNKTTGKYAATDILTSLKNDAKGTKTDIRKMKIKEANLFNTIQLMTFHKVINQCPPK